MGSQAGIGDPAPPRPRGIAPGALTLSRVLFLLAAALAGAVVTLYFGSDRLPALDPERLAAARARWQAAGIHSYRLRLEMEGTELEKGVYEVDVERGVVTPGAIPEGAPKTGPEVTTASRNGQPITGDAGAYAVDGLFQLLAQELDLAEDPVRSGQAAPGYHIYLFAEFDPERGLPRRFRRVVGGSSRWAEWRVREFTAK